MACTDPDATEAARRTGNARYLVLLDPDRPEYDPRYKPVAAAIARGPAPAPPPPARTMSHVRAEWVNSSGYFCRDCATGCQASVCHAGRGGPNGRVTLADCLKCLRGEAEPEHKETRP